ncbi:MAG: hypothetical protein NT062_31370 [Proteobacteria bacterium]|nr:hypothetical protein [Pseudomonadota bacterium]
MRPIMILLGFLTACASATRVDEPPPIVSVREHLESPTRLHAATGTSGAITARRWARDGWLSADVPIVLEHGAIDAVVDRDGRLTLTDLELDLAPIEIPANAVGTAARLDHLRLTPITLPLPATTMWTGDDRAVATTALDLELAWAVTIDDATTTLGPQHLPPIIATFTIGGSDGEVDVTVDLSFAGPLWSWFGIIELADLRLQVETSSDRDSDHTPG